MSDTPKSVLAELVLHLSYDSGVNGSKFTDNPIGRLVISQAQGSLWTRASNVMNGNGPEIAILCCVLGEIGFTAEVVGNPPYLVGSLFLTASEGSLWRRALDVVGYDPDMVRDVVIPAIEKRITGGSVEGSQN